MVDERGWEQMTIWHRGRRLGRSNQMKPMPLDPTADDRELIPPPTSQSHLDRTWRKWRYKSCDYSHGEKRMISCCRLPTKPVSRRLLMKRQAGRAGQQLPLSSPLISLKNWSCPRTINLSEMSSSVFILMHNSWFPFAAELICPTDSSFGAQNINSHPNLTHLWQILTFFLSELCRQTGLI